jgi:hypothetical protein
MGHKDALDREEVIEFVMSCWDDEIGTFLCFAGVDRLLTRCCQVHLEHIQTTMLTYYLL